MLYEKASDMIGGTPLLDASRFCERYGVTAKILAKLEYLNPTGSAKDRAALYMLDEAERSGLLTPGTVVIEETSGNTGIGLASLCAQKGYEMIAVMPDTMSIERRKLLAAYGAKIELTPGKEGMDGACRRVEELKDEYEKVFVPSQFDNKANPLSHYETTAPEILRDTDGKIDCFVAAFGTGGTVSGCAKYLKEQLPKIKTFAVEPESSPLVTKGYSAPHKLQGIGANFIPVNLDPSVIDEYLTAGDDESIEAARAFAKCEGVLCGISSGAALAAAVKLARREEYKNAAIVVILCDGGERYLSSGLYE